MKALPSTHKYAQKFLPLVTVIFACIASQAFAQKQVDKLPGISFSHNDWELVCDNTRTCRAAGYQKDDGDAAGVSVLLTRKAGPNEAITGELQIGQSDDNVIGQLAENTKLTMLINGQSQGVVSINKKDLIAALSPQQVNALIGSLSRSSTIEWRAGKQRWILSDKGAAAVLLKMDEFQGRLGTRNAAIKKGNLGDDAVLPALPLPSMIAATIVRSLPTDAEQFKKQNKEFRNALIASTRTEGTECEQFSEAEIEVRRLSKSKVLVSGLCWRAAYNEGYAFAVMNDAPPYQPVLVTTDGSSFDKGAISLMQKGRGIGDCIASETWVWNSQQFVHTSATSSGMCRGIAAGGAWSLPRLVMRVNQRR